MQKELFTTFEPEKGTIQVGNRDLALVERSEIIKLLVRLRMKLWMPPYKVCHTGQNCFTTYYIQVKLENLDIKHSLRMMTGATARNSEDDNWTVHGRGSRWHRNYGWPVLCRKNFLTITKNVIWKLHYYQICELAWTILHTSQLRNYVSLQVCWKLLIWIMTSALEWHARSVRW